MASSSFSLNPVFIIVVRRLVLSSLFAIPERNAYKLPGFFVALKCGVLKVDATLLKLTVRSDKELAYFLDVANSFHVLLEY